MTHRRSILRGAAALGTAALLPATVRAQAGDVFTTDRGEIVVHPVEHASFVMETPAGVIHVDPVGDPELYADLPQPDLILITHEHGDHFSMETIQGISKAATQMLVNPAVYDMLPPEMQAMTQEVANSEVTDAIGIEIEAIPAYNLTEGRLDFHPEGRDNGYVLNIDGVRVYVSGDTEGVEAMRNLEDIIIAFVCMNLPFTMGVEQAADAVADFSPQVVYPYHFRGRDGGTQDPEEFARLLSETDAETEVRIANWYPDGLG